MISPQKVAVNQSGFESRFRKLQTVVESGAEEIRLLAAERGAPIGNDLLKQRTTKTNSRCQIEPSNACYGRRGIRCLMS